MYYRQTAATTFAVPNICSINQTNDDVTIIIVAMKLSRIKEDIVEGMTVEIMQLFERIFQFTFERQAIKSCEKCQNAPNCILH